MRKNSPSKTSIQDETPTLSMSSTLIQQTTKNPDELTPQFQYKRQSYGPMVKSRPKLNNEIKAKQWQIQLFKQKLADTLESNSGYERNLKQISYQLNHLALEIRSIFFDDSASDQQISVSEEISMKQFHTIFGQIEQTIDRIVHKLQQKKANVHPVINELKKQLIELDKSNEKLLGVIQVSKRYSEKLKYKIRQLKDNTVKINEQLMKNSEYLHHLEQDSNTPLDLKYASRQKLINIIKFLMFKVRKCENLYDHPTRLDFDELAPKKRQKLGSAKSCRDLELQKKINNGLLHKANSLSSLDLIGKQRFLIP